MNQSVSALGSVVRATRKSKNLSQEALAEKLGVCKRTIIDIEKNTGNPKFELLCMLVREPVSYTHLDVYKRQIYVLRCKAESDCCIMVADSFRGGMANGGFNKIL